MGTMRLHRDLSMSVPSDTSTGVPRMPNPAILSVVSSRMESARFFFFFLTLSPRRVENIVVWDLNVLLIDLAWSSAVLIAIESGTGRSGRPPFSKYLSSVAKFPGPY